MNCSKHTIKPTHTNNKLFKSVPMGLCAAHKMCDINIKRIHSRCSVA